MRIVTKSLLIFATAVTIANAVAAPSSVATRIYIDNKTKYNLMVSKVTIKPNTNNDPIEIAFKPGTTQISYKCKGSVQYVGGVTIESGTTSYGSPFVVSNQLQSGSCGTLYIQKTNQTLSGEKIPVIAVLQKN